MTREEITKEAQEQVNYCTPIHPEDFIHGYIAAAENWQAKCENQKEINKELVDENEALKFAARMSEKTEEQLRKENENLKVRLNAINLLTPELEKEAKKKKLRIEELEKENAVLKATANFQQTSNMERHFELKRQQEQLAQAKELIKGLLDLPGLIEDRTIEHTELIGRAEQFLEEAE